MEVRRFNVSPSSIFIQGQVEGPIGCTNPQVFLRTSAPDMAPRPKYSDKELIQMGSNIQRGGKPSPYTKGLAGVVVENTAYSSSVKPRITSYMYEGRAPLERSSLLLPRPQDAWKSKVLNIENRATKNADYYPLPNGYNPSGQSRGREPVRITIVDPESFGQTAYRRAAGGIAPAGPSNSVGAGPAGVGDGGGPALGGGPNSCPNNVPVKTEPVAPTAPGKLPVVGPYPTKKGITDGLRGVFETGKRYVPILGQIADAIT